jgi:general secretion pathway protein D
MFGGWSVKKTAALLLAGLVAGLGVSVGTASAASPGAESAKTETRRPKAGGDFLTLNFTNIDISALVKVMSELMRRNFILDERVTGKVTLMTPTRISPDEAYQVFLSALELKGFTAVEDGMITRIIPSANARQSGLKVFKDNGFNDQGFATKLVRLTYVNPNEVVRTLTPLISRDGSMIAYPATNSIIITDATPNIRKMESLIRSLDMPASEGKGRINVYYLKNANSEEFAKVLSALVSRMPAPTPTGAQPIGVASILEGQVTITSDKATNSLIIVASPGDYETIRDVIQKLDIRRRQVYVEAAIVEMSLSKSRELGFEFLYAPQEIQSGPGAPTTPLGGTNFGNIAPLVGQGPAALANTTGLTVAAIKGTFTYNNITYLNVGALIHALQTNGDVNVLSTPNIMTTDNQKAEIMVGQNVPFVGSQTQSANTGGIPTYNIDRKDVGITLKLTPQITSDDNVRLDVYQEISDIVQTVGINPNLLGPSTSKRSASTTVVVKDRETMVIGGLIRDNVTTNTSKVPLLGDIPILGWLFKYQTTKVEKTNLMIFLTPYIIHNEYDAEDITLRKGQGLEEFRQKYGIEKKSAQPTMLTPTTTQRMIEQKKERERAAPEPGQAAPGVQSAPTGTPGSMNAPLEGQPAAEGAVPGMPPNGSGVGSAPTGTASPAEGSR